MGAEATKTPEGKWEDPKTSDNQADLNEGNQGNEGQDLENQGDGQGEGDSDDPKGKKRSQEGDGEDSDDMSKWEPAKVRDYVKKLRSEAKDGRIATKKMQERLERLEGGLKNALGIEENSDVSPEDQIAMLQSENLTTDFRLATLEAAVQNGITGEGVEYFEFLIQKKASALEEDEELSEEDVAEIANSVKAKFGAGSTARGTSPAGGSPAPGKGGDVTLEQFAEMSLGKRSELYEKNKSR